MAMLHQHTPDEWATILAPDQAWGVAYPCVEAAAREWLSILPPAVTVSTVGLAESLWPAKDVRGPGQMKARQRIFAALAACAKHSMADCATQGEPETNGFHGVIRRWQWHYAVSRPPCCPTCKRPL